MECDICTEHFDGAERVPKSLPCGHTACLQCLRRLPDRRCPTCRRDFNCPPERLPTNFSLLQLLEGVRLDSYPRGWCSGCGAAATPRCWEDHDVVSVRSALRRQLQDALPQAAEQLQGLQDQCRDEQALPALTLLTGGARGGVRGGAHGGARGGARGPRRAESCLAREMDVDGVFWSLDAHARDDVQQKKAAALRDAPGVTLLRGVHCSTDPIWTLDLLQCAAPTLEELSVDHPSVAHLRVVHAMPRLRRLEVTGGPIPDPADTLLAALPPGHASLKVLLAVGVPRATLQSLLRAYARTLEWLKLVVGTVEDDGWPWSCDDLHSLLEPCGLAALRWVVFKREHVNHGTVQCDKQCGYVRLLLPAVAVFCDVCDEFEFYRGGE